MTKTFGKIFTRDRNTKLIRKTSSNYLRDYRNTEKIFGRWSAGEQISDGDKFSFINVNLGSMKKNTFI